jgi:colicin import membrane protein
MVAVKKQIQGEGITAFEQDPRYKKVTQCRTNIDEIFDEEKCRNLNKKPSYNSYSNYNSSSFFGAHRYDPNLEINKRTELNIMNALKDNFSYPYTGLRSQYDPKDIHRYPRYTVNRFVMEMVRTNIHKYEISDRCVKKFIKIYETDAENAAKQAAKDAEKAAKEAEKAAKEAEKAAKEAEEAAKEAKEVAEKSHTVALIMSELKKKFSYPYTGLRSISDSHDLKVFPRCTAYAYFLNFFKNEPDKHRIVIHSCVKMFKIVYETDAKFAAQREKDAEKETEKASEKPVNKATAKAAAKAKKEEIATKEAERRAAAKAINERLKEIEKEEKAAAKEAAKAAKAEKAAAKAAEKAAKNTQKTKPKQNKTKKSPKEPSPKSPSWKTASPNNEKRKRCPNGTRRNKKTGDCEKYN